MTTTLMTGAQTDKLLGILLQRGEADYKYLKADLGKRRPVKVYFAVPTEDWDPDKDEDE